MIHGMEYSILGKDTIYVDMTMTVAATYVFPNENPIGPSLSFTANLSTGRTCWTWSLHTVASAS